MVHFIFDLVKGWADLLGRQLAVQTLPFQLSTLILTLNRRKVGNICLHFICNGRRLDMKYTITT